MSEELDYLRSSHCSDSACVEVAWLDENVIMLRNSEHPEKFLRFTAAEWNAFIAGIKDGEFDV